MSNTNKYNTLLEVVWGNCICTYDMSKVEAIRLQDTTVYIELVGNNVHPIKQQTLEQVKKLYKQLCERWSTLNGYIQT